jgi:plastocyanin
MQFKGFSLVASAFIFAACGGSDAASSADVSTPAAAPAAATPAAATVAMVPATGRTHEIRMVGDDKGYRFEPANLTIKSGDAVKFIAISGFPHNVAFDAAGLAANVRAQLDANFGTSRAAELMSAMYMTPNESATISFAAIPAGVYHFNCTPHLAMGMTGIITVQ